MANYIYCTHTLRAGFPTFLKPSFGDLDDFLRTIISTATKKVTIVAPYLSAFGLLSISGSLAVCRERGAKIRIVTEISAGERDRNVAAIRELDEKLNHGQGPGIQVLANVEGLSMLHSKLILADSASGYLGSANFSRRGLEQNFEVGVSLGPHQARALEDLIDHFEACNMLVDRSSRVLTVNNPEISDGHLT